MNRHNSETLIYIGSCQDELFNKVIVENHQFITDRFNEVEISFIYLPKLLSDESFRSIMDYNRPYFSNYNQTDLRELYLQLKKQYNITTDKPSFVYISEKANEGYGFELTPPSDEITREHLAKQIDEILKNIQLIRVENEILEEQDSGIRFSIGDDMFSGIFCEEESEEYSKKNADANFHRDAFEIPEDLRKRINDLKEAGYLSKLIEFLEELQKTTRKLSRLHITKDFKIYLMDYGMKEIRMSPLPKALFLLFLKHPEGILFKELTDYRSELMNIYKNISLRENPDEARESIIRMTDPFDNSINEKCSMIRNAFLRVVTDDIAEYYYIRGIRGKPKKILLDRELVIHDHQSGSQGL